MCSVLSYLYGCEEQTYETEQQLLSLIRYALSIRQPYDMLYEEVLVAIPTTLARVPIQCDRQVICQSDPTREPEERVLRNTDCDLKRKIGQWILKNTSNQPYLSRI